MSQIRVVFTGGFLALLCACSDGEGDSPMHGQFIDSPVSGIRFSTETRSGITDAEGRFEYEAGETVSFYLGDLFLGDAPAAAMISPFDLVDDVVQPVVGGALKRAILERPRGPGLSTVINMVTLLQTLDIDGDPENGIEIAPGVASLFTPNSVDLNQPWQAFSHDLGLRRAIAEAKVRAALDGARQVRKPWRAMAHLYASLGIESELRVERVASGDSDADGNANYVIRYEYDAEGKIAREVFNSTDEATPDRIRTYTYDTDGNLIRYAEDDNNDGAHDSITNYGYDADGNQDVYAYDRDGDGNSDYIETYTYNTDGNRTRSVRDTDGDGSPDHISDDTYDAQGNLSVSEQDSNGDGIPEYIYNYSYHVVGNSIRTERDVDGDGMADRVDTIIYDAEGNVLSEEYDDDADGALETILTYAYDERGNETRSAYDWNADGAPDSIHTNTYDANDNVTLYTYDSNGSGTPEQIHSLYYDESGYEIRREQEINGTGAPDRIITTTYDSDSDGWWWTFNRASKVVAFIFTTPDYDPGGSGTIEQSYSLTLGTSSPPATVAD